MQILGLSPTLFVPTAHPPNMKQLPTLPPVLDEEDRSSSPAGSSESSPRPTLPVDADLEVAELPEVDLPRPGARGDLPLPNKSEETSPFVIRDGLAQRVEPLPAPDLH